MLECSLAAQLRIVLAAQLRVVLVMFVLHILYRIDDQPFCCTVSTDAPGLIQDCPRMMLHRLWSTRTRVELHHDGAAQVLLHGYCMVYYILVHRYCDRKRQYIYISSI